MSGGHVARRRPARLPAVFVIAALAWFPAVAPALAADEGAPAGTSASPAASKAAASKSKSAKSKSSKREQGAVQFSGAFAFEVAYDENVIHYSEADLGEFESLPTFGKFSISSADDWILRPRVDLVLKSRRLTGNTLEALLRLSSWRYVENTIKNNESVTLRLKHPGFGKDNFQLTFYHAPEQYLRNFRDRPPFAPLSTPSEYTEFRLRSTSLGLAYARTLNPKFDLRAEVRKSWRYFNQPFMENDNWEWRIGGSVAYRPVRPFKVTAEYFYSDVEARAADQAGETAATSNDGDGSYLRDAYRLAFDLYFKERLGPLAHVTLEGSYQAFYYTSTRALADDPTHVGRKDENVQFEIGGDTRPVIGPVSLEGGFRWSKRDSSAPGAAIGAESIDEEKDYTDRRVWAGFEIPF